MKFFIDSSDVKEIRRFYEMGLVDGVTTNPSLVAESGRDFIDLITEIASFVLGPISAEVTALDAENMILQGKRLATISKQVTVKLPLTKDGLIACHTLSSEGISTNVTLCFSAGQALLAAKAGATFVSPFVGRLDDQGQDGMVLIKEICQIFSNYSSIKTQVLVASVRHPIHLIQAAQMGADVATMPPKVMDKLFIHPLTDLGLAKFMDDWQKTGQSF